MVAGLGQVTNVLRDGTSEKKASLIFRENKEGMVTGNLIGVTRKEMERLEGD